MPGSNKSKVKVGVCGFGLGNDHPTDEPMDCNNYELTFFKTSDTSHSFEDFNGIIMPSGAFERINFAQETHSYNRDLILDRQRQAVNLLKSGGWLCFLVDRVYDEMNVGYGHTRNINDTDLCKRFLNYYDIDRRVIDGYTILQSKFDSFKKYIKNYGVAKTLFTTHYDSTAKVLVVAGREKVGLVDDDASFFLPYHIAGNDKDQVITAIRYAVEGILDYRGKHRHDLPEWLNEFRFENEEPLIEKREKVNSKLIEINSELNTLQHYKGIIVSSGDYLVDQVTVILRSFFGLEIDDTDEKKEDVKIMGLNNKVEAMVEIKGVNSGVKREHINQVDSHRERAGFDSSMPGLLLINNNMKLTGLEKKVAAGVAEEQIKHAENINVLILRTVDFLYFMRKVENVAIQQRKKMLMDIIKKQNGWHQVAKKKKDNA